MCKNISRLVLFAAIASLTVSAVSNGALQAQEGLFNALRGGEAKQVAARARTEAGEERSANSSRAVRLQEMNREASNLYKLRSTGELVLSSMHESCPQLAQLHVTGRGGEERVRVVDLER